MSCGKCRNLMPHFSLFSERTERAVVTCCNNVHFLFEAEYSCCRCFQADVMETEMQTENHWYIAQIADLRYQFFFLSEDIQWDQWLWAARVRRNPIMHGDFMWKRQDNEGGQEKKYSVQHANEDSICLCIIPRYSRFQYWLVLVTTQTWRPKVFH